MAVARDEMRFFAESGDVHPSMVGIVDEPMVSAVEEDASVQETAPDFQAMIQMLVQTYFGSGPAAYAELIEEHRMQLVLACALSEQLKRILLIGLEMGAEVGDGACAHELGSLYYMGDIVEQDYERAEALYRLAADAGFVQAMVNLGYIYEYGRVGAPDYEKAYAFYSFAAAAFDDPEALYKMGDMFARGKGVERDERAAYTLWMRSFDGAEDVRIKAQAALRMAQALMDPESAARIGIPCDPLYCLELFQLAERGLRLSISEGLTYYEKRLGEAMEGQCEAREMLA